tara:strand:+ start:5555 stop:6124 length:570 start_codon:yes stop_codon:yes gene_type:complete
MAEDIKIEIKPEVSIAVKKTLKPFKIDVKFPTTISLNLRRALNGDYLIYDHPLFDIAIMPGKNKIVSFRKREPKTDPYPSQDKYFDYLMRLGMVVQDSIQGGNVYGSLEAVYPINDKVDTIQALLLATYNFLKDEKELFRAVDEFEEEYDDSLLDPNPEDSTELGEVPQAAKKGSIDPNSLPYGLTYRI